MDINKEESYKIQIIRGIAIIAVVCIHNIPSGMEQVWYRPFVNFAVGMFLFLSGLLSNNNHWRPWHRIKKVLIPYVIWSLIYTILYNHSVIIHRPQIILINLITGQSAAIMYYIFVYCELTLFIPLIERLAKSKYKTLGFLVSPCEIILIRLIPMVLGFKLPNVVNIIIHVSCVGWFTYYYLGYLIGNNYLRYKEINTKMLVIGVCGGLVLQVIEGYIYFNIETSNCGTQLKLSAIITGLLLSIIALKFIKSRVQVKMQLIHLIGDYSFGIYFSHLAIMFGLEHFNISLPYPINACIVVCLSLGFVLIMNRVLGKYAKYIGM